MDTNIALKIPPGMRNTGTVYQSKGRWYSGNFVRFFNDTIQPIGGWVARSLSGATISGVPRAAITYKLPDGTQCLVIGTTVGIYVVKGTVVTDISFVGIATATDRIWHLDVAGSYLVATYRTAGAPDGRIFYWTGDTATDLVEIANGHLVSVGPDVRLSQACLGSFVTAERFLVQLGGVMTNAVP